MKTFPAALLALAILPATVFAADPAAALHREQLASFIARVAYAKSQPASGGFHNNATGLTCTLYTVKQGLHGAPGYTLVVATDPRTFGNGDMDFKFQDMIVLCDKAVADPDTGVKCAGHVIAVQGNWLTQCGEGATLQFSLGKRGESVKISGPHKLIQL